MRSLLCEHFCSESLPYCDRKFVKRCDSGNKRDTWRAGDSEIKLVADPLVRNTSYSIGKAGGAFYACLCFCRSRAQESFGQRLRGGRAPAQFPFEINFPKKTPEGGAFHEMRYSPVGCQAT